ncbi:MAG: hypothetical protein AB8F94_02835 [Saprospiraceae bacterium]
MTKTNHLSKGRLALIFGVPLLLISGITCLTFLPVFASQNLSYAITLDLIFTVPIVYFLLIRKTEIPKTTTLTFLILGAIIASFIIPKEHQTILAFAKQFLIPIIEVSIFFFIIFKIRKVYLAIQSAKSETPDFLEIARKVVGDILPKKAAGFFLMELSLFYYCFHTWRKPILPNNAFTYHKRSDLSLIFGVFIGLILVETFAFHILVERWSPIVAWIGTSLSLYSIVQVVGIIKSASRRPILLNERSAVLRFGMMAETEIAYEDIDRIELSQRTISNNPLAKKLGTELTSHNVVIYLKKENILHGLFGIKNNFNILSLFVDDHKRFKEEIDQRL